MIAKVICIPDLHKRWKDGESIKNQIDVQIQIQQDIVDTIQREGITHLLQLGDWYDRGFHGLCMVYGAWEMDRRISAAVNGNAYLLIGNHFFLERDENPEMYIIQPNEFVRPQYDIPLPSEPMFKLVPSLRLGDVQIDFFHYSKVDKMYYNPVEAGVKYHIGLYHDDVCVPGFVREQEGYTSTDTSSLTLNKIYQNIDLAVHGHIHARVGTCEVTLSDGRQVPLIIPGALGITQNKSQFKHKDVDCPVLTIEDDSTVKISFVKIPTHIDRLQFYETKQKKQKTLFTEEQISTGQNAPIVNKVQFSSLTDYMSKKGYTPTHMKMIDAAAQNKLSLIEAITIIREGDS